MDAATATGKGATRIQKTFQQFSKDNEPLHLDPNGILEEAFETGVAGAQEDDLQGAGQSRRASLQVPSSAAREDELVMLETDSSYMPQLPREVTSSPTKISTHVEQERHSDYDKIMDDSVMGQKSTFNASYGFPASTTASSSRHTATGPLFAMSQAEEVRHLSLFCGLLFFGHEGSHGKFQFTIQYWNCPVMLSYFSPAPRKNRSGGTNPINQSSQSDYKGSQ